MVKPLDKHTYHLIIYCIILGMAVVGKSEDCGQNCSDFIVSHCDVSIARERRCERCDNASKQASKIDGKVEGGQGLRGGPCIADGRRVCTECVMSV